MVGNASALTKLFPRPASPWKSPLRYSAQDYPRSNVRCFYAPRGQGAHLRWRCGVRAARRRARAIPPPPAQRISEPAPPLSSPPLLPRPRHRRQRARPELVLVQGREVWQRRALRSLVAESLWAARTLSGRCRLQAPRATTEPARPAARPMTDVRLSRGRRVCCAPLWRESGARRRASSRPAHPVVRRAPAD